MTIQELIEMLDRRIVHLSALRASAVAIGDLAQVDALDSSIAQSSETRNLLLTLV